jgi:hypothetical protein
MECRRCFQPVEEGELERCWYCEGALCVYCRDRFGVCGCPGSDQAQEDLIHATNASERRAILRRALRPAATPPRRRAGGSRSR